MERFLREQGWKHQGSLPLLEASLEELGNRLGQFFEGSGLSRGIPDGLFPCGLREAFRKRGYWAMEDLLGYYLGSYAAGFSQRLFGSLRSCSWQYMTLTLENEIRKAAHQSLFPRSTQGVMEKGVNAASADSVARGPPQDL